MHLQRGCIPHGPHPCALRFFEAFLRDGRAARVAAEALEPSPVTRWDSDLGVYVDAAALARALVLARAGRVHDPEQWLARSVASEAVTCSCRAAADAHRRATQGGCAHRAGGI